MASVSILVADDIMAQSKKARKRSDDLRSIATHFARLLKADLHFLYVEDIPERLRKGDKIKSLDQRNPQMTAKLRAELEALNPGSELHLDRGNPILKALEWEKKLNPDLIVLGTRGHKGLSKFFLGSVAEELLRRSRRPVLVLGPHYSSAEFPANPRAGLRILLLSDLTSASSRAEAYTRKLAQKTKARVTLMHSVGDPIMRLRQIYAQSRIPMYSLEKEVQEIKDFARIQMKKKMERFKEDGLTVQAKLIEHDRDLADDIQDELTEGYDLVVMGTHAHNRLLTVFLGSTSRKTCLLSSVPVIILPSSS
ncbi:universal stress protein [Bdellovibrio bacteriovorus]|uniref:UspA domain-containing protein n=1 Tax=Bdellovibrio bacteriovorus (strain ATCC 15356 / DSM 50701 / NCIMB 9529 / HD100) TaxID=264462 RepID=Q6MGV2_BDEBA|nr:universal stress protein [Bdellovibrio bacteriovorus]AHZ85572.1 hypothetical protein EP01_11595 [Bdellovibrio bacteriovorus]BEV70118.1 hypothetical protein Bb109J_c3538 [Bdellovibrio bacteriovorus]CAE81177.1 hypothetical protein predicted by Glimmer/Critica [Bdellovibrio bacteriovorus HD100]